VLGGTLFTFAADKKCQGINYQQFLRIINLAIKNAIAESGDSSKHIYK
jgi:hypothetical protein